MFPCSCILFVTNDTASECIDLDDDGLENKPGSSPAIQDRLVIECNILVIHFIFLPMISSQEEALIDQGEVISLASTSTKDLKHIQLLNTNLFIFGFVLFIYTVCTSESLICFLRFLSLYYQCCCCIPTTSSIGKSYCFANGPGNFRRWK